MSFLARAGMGRGRFDRYAAATSAPAATTTTTAPAPARPAATATSTTTPTAAAAAAPAPATATVRPKLNLVPRGAAPGAGAAPETSSAPDSARGDGDSKHADGPATSTSTSTSSTSSTSSTTVLSEQQFNKKIQDLLNEYLSANDINEVKLSIKEYNVPEYHYRIIYETGMMIMNQTKQPIRAKLIDLITQLITSNPPILTPADCCAGARALFHALDEDLLMDFPRAGEFLSELISQLVIKTMDKDDGLTLNMIVDGLQQQHLIETGQAAMMMASIIKAAKQHWVKNKTKRERERGKRERARTGHGQGQGDERGRTQQSAIRHVVMSSHTLQCHVMLPLVMPCIVTFTLFQYVLVYVETCCVCSL